MVRYAAVALLALLPAAVAVAQVADATTGKEIKFAGKLTANDTLDKKRNAASKVYVVRMKAGSAYTIDMVSSQFDSYLRLEDKGGKELAEDDDSGGMLNAQIVFACPRDGEYHVICTAYAAGGIGDYTLTVKSRKEEKVISAHSLLIGKAAPDFQADFAVNGKAVKLSDLKGKVVLVEFWTVRDAACAATFPRLRAWHKAHKGDGLEVLGVTYYLSDINQPQGFDAKTGTLRSLPAGNREGDRTLLRDFAAYHKLDYPLLALTKEEALKAYDAYAVNGIPQTVLIDRKGVVRTVRVGEDERTLAALEGELKKVLAEK